MKPALVVAALLAFAVARPGTSQDVQLSALARMPIKEITVFKDGHVFALHEGAMLTDAAGNVVLEQLPAPVLGTFWPYSSDKAAKLRSVVAGRRRVAFEQTAVSLRELIDANTGAEVVVTEKSDAGKEPVRFSGTLLGVPARHERESSAPRFPDAQVVVDKGAVVLVKTADGVRVGAIDEIKDITFKGAPKATGAREELRSILSLQLDWGSHTPQKTANVGLVYLQKGMRWIPSYRVAIDGKGTASVRLQATLINELIDVDDVTAHLVIGVPQFAFKETLDPIALQQQAAQLSQYFQQGERAGHLSNSIMSQAVSFNPAERADIGPDAAPPVDESGRNEDLFVFTIKNITLKKNERMVLTVAEYSVPYKDMFTLDVPLAPPVDAVGNLNSEQQAELAHLLASPKVTHKLRLSNDSRQPFTTAPALVFKDERLLAQGTMTYGAPGSKVELEITKAVDVSVSKSERETSRTPNAVKSQGYDYARVDLDGALSLVNRRSVPVEVEVVRHVLGDVDTATNGQVVKTNVFEDDTLLQVARFARSEWWHRLNGVSRITWTVKLEAGAKADLTYKWHYFVR